MQNTIIKFFCKKLKNNYLRVAIRKKMSRNFAKKRKKDEKEKFICKDSAMSAIVSQNLNRASNFAKRGKKVEVNSPFLQF